MRGPSFVLSLLLLLWGCGNSKKQVSNNQHGFYLSMEKTACFGQCPIYVLKVNSDGGLHLNAKRFNDISGEFEAKLSKDEFQNLKATTTRLDWDAFDEEYLTGYSDLPSTILTYAISGDTTKVRYESDKAPQELISLSKQMESWKHNKDWESLIIE